ncbi:MAG: hypothetical protein WBP36_05815, partial [Thermoanaerobaculia bacterium]
MSRKLLLLSLTMMFLALTCCQGQHDQQQSPTTDAVSSAQDIMSRIEEVEGGLWSTPSDLCLFAIEVQRALRGESSIISRQLAEEMLTVHVGSHGLGVALQGEGE